MIRLLYRVGQQVGQMFGPHYCLDAGGPRRDDTAEALPGNARVAVEYVRLLLAQPGGQRGHRGWVVERRGVRQGRQTEVRGTIEKGSACGGRWTDKGNAVTLP